MASDKEFLNFVLEQMDGAGLITSRYMFGEYGIYCDGKFMALIGDNKLYIKPTVAGRAFVEDLVEAPPYPGAKNYFLIEEKLEDKDWLSNLVRITAEELPEPKPKKKRKKKKKG